MMEKYKKLIFVIIVLLFFGCSSTDVSLSLCNAGWNTCASNEECHCWK